MPVLDRLQIENVPLSSLRSDGLNPNVMTPVQMAAMRSNIERWGFLVPIITNAEGVIADGEHRLDAARALGLETVPIVRLPVSEVDRRLLRQVMNKLRGQHDYERDVEELEALAAQLGSSSALAGWLGETEAGLAKYLAPYGGDAALPAVDLVGDARALQQTFIVTCETMEQADLIRGLFQLPKAGRTILAADFLAALEPPSLPPAA